jgi:hypothetical protein
MMNLIVPSPRDGRLFYELSSPEVVGLLMSARVFLGTVPHTSLVLLPDDAVRAGSGYELAAEA